MRLLPAPLRLTIVALAVQGCVAGATGTGADPFGGGTNADGSARGSGTDVPAGYGTLRQDDITLEIESGDLLLKVTPMAEAVIRLTAPDTYERLRSLARSHRAMARERTGMEEPELFLVSVFSNAPNVPFEPEDLAVLSHGRRYRPVAIQPVTPGWGAQRLEQRQTRIAVYVFEAGIDLETDLQVEHRMARDNGWS
ncbi:MAG: hypothetical protein WDZ89_04465, partial [Gemmatimonadota bacterium]